MRKGNLALLLMTLLVISISSCGGKRNKDKDIRERYLSPVETVEPVDDYYDPVGCFSPYYETKEELQNHPAAKLRTTHYSSNYFFNQKFFRFNLEEICIKDEYAYGCQYSCQRAAGIEVSLQNPQATTILDPNYEVTSKAICIGENPDLSCNEYQINIELNEHVRDNPTVYEHKLKQIKRFKYKLTIDDGNNIYHSNFQSGTVWNNTADSKLKFLARPDTHGNVWADSFIKVEGKQKPIPVLFDLMLPSNLPDTLVIEAYRLTEPKVISVKDTPLLKGEFTIQNRNRYNNGIVNVTVEFEEMANE